MISQLPAELLGHICEFLYLSDIVNIRCCDQNLHQSVNQFKGVKIIVDIKLNRLPFHNDNYFYLSKDNSLHYYRMALDDQNNDDNNDSDDREDIIIKQISLNWRKLSTLSILDQAEKVKIKYCRIPHREYFLLRNCRHLDLSGCQINDSYWFSDIRILNLSDNPNISDVSMLGRVHKLNLSRTNVTDVSMLGEVYDLNLSNTPVNDVSRLGKVHKLNLSNTNVTDVSMLGGVYDLNLSWTRVSDVSRLGKVRRLILESSFVTDVSALGSVYTLSLRDTRVEDVSALGDVVNLDLSYTQVTDVSMLGRVKLLDISFTAVRSIAGLENCELIVSQDLLHEPSPSFKIISIIFQLIQYLGIIYAIYRLVL